MSVEVNNESGAEVDERALAELARFLLDALRIDPLAEVSVLLVDAYARWDASQEHRPAPPVRGPRRQGS